MVAVQDMLPNEISKDAVPVVDGVPDTLYIKVPEPLASVPACREAVSPVTPVDVTEELPS